MIMEKKSNKGVIVLIVLLILCIIGLVFYILVDKDIIKLNNTTVANEQVEKNNTDDDNEEKDTGVKLDIENENIKYLFNNAHRPSIGPEAQIYRDGGYKVSEMSGEDKILLLYGQWKNYVKESSIEIDNNYNSMYYVNEADLKSIYERTFGPDTYSHVNSITDSYRCYTYTYDDENKRFFYVGANGCGGTTVFSVHEKIISATKYNDRIEIVSAAFYINGMDNQMYKDYNQTTSLGEYTYYNNNYTDEERNNLEDQYIDDNKDNLEQYTYTYTLNDDGFYYLTSVERTKA